MCGKMCKDPNEKERLNLMAMCATELLAGTPVSELAKKLKLSEDEIEEILKSIKTLNPYLYEQLQTVQGNIPRS